MEWMNEAPGGLDVRIKAVPRAAKNEIQGVHDGALKIRLTTPPVDGKANQALIKFLSKTLNISKAQIELAQGETSRHKTVRISGLTKQQLIERIGV
ncbi:MAG: YggU family protein [Kiritimatiellales bacterium]|nr:YggU family protein [Kiritimatiellota bacterium]MBL7012668.1 YggU family protein [Kiritimatiellales bacterium]